MVDVPVALVVQVPLYLAATCTLFGVRLWSTGLWIFCEIPGMFRIQLSLVRQWIRVRRQSTRLSGRISHVLFVKAGFGSIPRGWLGDLQRAIFAAFFDIFSHSVRMDVSAYFSALDDEEFFVVEGSGWRGRWESDSQVFCHLN